MKVLIVVAALLVGFSAWAETNVIKLDEDMTAMVFATAKVRPPKASEIVSLARPRDIPWSVSAAIRTKNVEKEPKGEAVARPTRETSAQITPGKRKTPGNVLGEEVIPRLEEAKPSQPSLFPGVFREPDKVVILRVPLGGRQNK